MKVLKIFLVVVVALVVLVVAGLFIFLKTFDVNRYLPQITSQVSAQMGKAFAIGRADLSLSLSRGIALTAKDVALHQDNSFSSAKIVDVKSANLALDVMTFLRERKIRVVAVSIVSPKMNLVRDKNGVFNVIPAPAASSSSEKSAAASAKSNAPQTNQPATVNLPVLLVDKVSVESAEVSYSDFALTPPVAIQVSKIDIVVTNFSLTAPFTFDVKAALLSPAQNIHAVGTVKLAMDTLQATVSDVAVTTDLASIDLAQLKKSVPQLNGVLGKALAGAVKVNIKELVAGPQGLSKLALAGSLQDGAVGMDYQNITIKPVTADLQVDEKNVVVKDFTMGVGGGMVKAVGRIDGYLTTQAYEGAVVMSGISPAPFVPDLGEGAKFEGTIDGKFDMKGQGFVPEQATKNLLGEGNLAVVEGRLVNFNVLKVVLSKIPMIPNLVEKLAEGLPDDLKATLTRQDTIFDEITLRTKISNGVININQADVAADSFSVKAKGTCDFDQNVNIKADFYIAAALSKAIVGDVNELSAIQEESGEIMVPLTSYNGQLSSLKIYPDLEYLGKKIIVNKGKQELQKLLGNVLGKDESTTSTTEGQTSTTEEEARPEEKIIKGVLDSIFPGK